MSKTVTETSSTKNLKDTWAFKTIQSYKDAATEAGLVLDYDPQCQSNDFPSDAVGQLENLKRLFVIGKDKHHTTVKNISRQNVHSVDKNGKQIVTEYITYGGEFRVTNHRGIEYGMEFVIGRHDCPKVVGNPNQTYDPKTSEALYNEKILVGQKPIIQTAIIAKHAMHIATNQQIPLRL